MIGLIKKEIHGKGLDNNNNNNNDNNNNNNNKG